MSTPETKPGVPENLIAALREAERVTWATLQEPAPEPQNKTACNLRQAKIQSALAGTEAARFALARAWRDFP